MVTDVEGPDVIARRAGRVLVIDAGGRVLLLHGFDPAKPDEPYWFTIGGGAPPGESLPAAAARALRGETALRPQADELGEPVWHEVTDFSFDGTSYRQEQDFFQLRIGSAVVLTDGLDDEEAAVIDGHRWWTVDELESSTEPFYPRELPRLLRDLSISA